MGTLKLNPRWGSLALPAWRHTLLVSFRRHESALRTLFAAVALSVLGGAFSPVLAADDQFQPQTKICLTVVQWMPSKGVYERWDALGGEFMISQAKTVSLPI
ncbi:MAG: hypothetical protein EOO82_03375, partial [Oxalobacteraceae bacterium]